MLLLVVSELGRFGEGDDGNGDAAPIELRFEFCHLAEVSLARESSQVTEEDQQ